MKDLIWSLSITVNAGVLSSSCFLAMRLYMRQTSVDMIIISPNIYIYIKTIIDTIIVVRVDLAYM